MLTAADMVERARTMLSELGWKMEKTEGGGGEIRLSAGWGFPVVGREYDVSVRCVRGQHRRCAHGMDTGLGMYESYC